jgi:hypothetical protein
VPEADMLRDEATRYVFDEPLAPIAIPTPLAASLPARLDRLAPVREMAQIGTAIPTARAGDRPFP